MNSLKIEKWPNLFWPNEFLIPTAKYVPKENIFCSMNIDEIREEKVFQKHKLRAEQIDMLPGS